VGFFTKIGSMSFFKNKHIIAAMIVTPILAILAYFVTDMFVKEKPQPAVAGKSYALLAKSNCRYTSGQCNLENGNFKSQLVIQNNEGVQVLRLETNHPITAASAGFVENEQAIDPAPMSAAGDNQKNWSMPMPIEPNERSVLRLAILANGAQYYAETTLGFSEYATSFKKNF